MPSKSEQPILFVTGFGRCGTTMAMTMLDAGGFPVSGNPPAYEPAEHWIDGKPDPDWISCQGGRAVKWIDPTRFMKMGDLLTTRPAILLMERDPAEQAKSQLKMIGPDATSLGRRARLAVKRSIIRDTPRTRAYLKNIGDVRRYRFEDFITNPIFAARALERFVNDRFDHGFDVDRAADAIITRTTKCLPDMTMETTILPVLAQEIADRKTPC